MEYACASRTGISGHNPISICWDTPTLREVWRTAPYLFDGRAATMEEVFEIHKHGIDKKVSKKEIKALTEYVNSL